MKILLTNDDGIDAPGLETLYLSVRHAFGESAEIVVVAPDRGRSECGHGVTSGRPLVVRQIKADWYSTDGTPVDCVRAALASLATDSQMVISGVNAGANLGVDLFSSGTFAAAREGAVQGVDAMAVSHYRRPQVSVTWDHVPQWLESTFTEFASLVEGSRRNRRGRESGDHSVPSDPAMLWNVNLPAVDPSSSTPPRVRCAVDTRPLVRTAKSTGVQLHLKSDFHGRPREQGSDVQCCFSGQLTISELSPHLR